MSLRISEVYESVQGEGPRVGKPTIFVRFAGCNLKCPGWPCDTQHAIDPKLYRQDWKEVDVPELVDLIGETGGTDRNICFTGGEPWLQKAEELKALVEALIADGYSVFECFTNGTFEFPEWAREMMYFVMDWKLKGSGDSFQVNMLKSRMKNYFNMDGSDAIKFVIKDDADLEEAIRTDYMLKAEAHRLGKRSFEVPETYYGVVWGAMKEADLIEKVLELGLVWRLNVQVHNHVWPRDQRGT